MKVAVNLVGHRPKHTANCGLANVRLRAPPQRVNSPAVSVRSYFDPCLPVLGRAPPKGPEWTHKRSGMAIDFWSRNWSANPLVLKEWRRMERQATGNGRILRRAPDQLRRRRWGIVSFATVAVTLTSGPSTPRCVETARRVANGFLRIRLAVGEGRRSQGPAALGAPARSGPAL